MEKREQNKQMEEKTSKTVSQEKRVSFYKLLCQ